MNPTDRLADYCDGVPDPLQQALILAVEGHEDLSLRESYDNSRGFCVYAEPYRATPAMSVAATTHQSVARSLFQRGRSRKPRRPKAGGAQQRRRAGGGA